MAHQVFLSHATEDRDTASRVCQMLEADGIQCWLASRDAISRKDKAAANLQAIRTADLVLLLVSASANASATVLRDVERAISYERLVLSIHLDDASPNLSLEYYLNLWQWLDTSEGVEDKREDIVAAVRGQLGTSDSAKWRRLDAPEGADSKYEEISAEVPGPLAPTSDSSTAQKADALVTVERRKPSRRTWAIAVGAAFVVLALGLGLGLGLAGTSHEDTWTRLDPTAALPPFAGPTVYEPSSGRLIMYAGGDMRDPSTYDIWAYDPAASTWTRLQPAGRVPSARSMAAVAYDPATRRLIMFGGIDRPGTYNGDGGWSYHNIADTWAYDPSANTWTELQPAGALPPARDATAVAYDPATRRLIMFGGWGADTPLDDTWTYDPVANTWTELKPSGTLPPEREYHAMVYDPSTGQMIMFGGWNGPDGFLNDTWAYDPTGNTWTNLNPSGTLPEKRILYGMAYDSSSHRVIMFGGQGAFDLNKNFKDTWAYDPSANTWTELKPSGALPGARMGPSLTYAPSTRQVIMFGGDGAGGSLNDTWAFTP